jgi:phosphopentomutase
MHMRAFLIVLDSVGAGAAPDADDYGDTGANTLGNLAAAVGGLDVPHLQRLGLGNIPALLPGRTSFAGVPPTPAPAAAFGAMQECSTGKDTTTGHWEMAGLLLKEGFALFPQTTPCFPPELIADFEARTGRRTIGNKHASGTAIIDELIDEHLRTGAWIVYTSADSVFQIAAHEDVIPLDDLYAACGVARELCNPYRVGRVIARPFIGQPGRLQRTDNRRDFSYPLPEPTILDVLLKHGIHTVTVGKLDDVFAGNGIAESIHVENNADAQDALLALTARQPPLFVFANLIDFDMRYGHRRDPAGYAHALEATDRFLGSFLDRLRTDDLLIISADHGNDPTFRGTDHTREYVPLLVRGAGLSGRNLGIRSGFFDVAQSLAAFFRAPSMSRGSSFLD